MAARPPRRRVADPARQRLRSDLIAFGFVAALLFGVTFLPPDTTLAQVRESGVLRVCVPDSFPPLVTGTVDRPGIDLELLAEAAKALDVRLLTVTNSAIGRDFNPRNWRVTRAQCLVLAGGIIDTTLTRSFLVVTPPHLETGWAAVAADSEQATLQDAQVGFFAGLTGLDRLTLSRWLRERGAQVTVLSDEQEANEGLASGRFDVVVSEGLTARRIAEAVGARAVWLPVGEGPVPVAFGLWKGDLTLERALERQLRRLERSGFVADLVERYALAPIADSCSFCN
ncbi:MAG: substrate-binding periplasmic protein [Trueperaceae bacterium]